MMRPVTCFPHVASIEIRNSLENFPQFDKQNKSNYGDLKPTQTFLLTGKNSQLQACVCICVCVVCVCVCVWCVCVCVWTSLCVLCVVLSVGHICLHTTIYCIVYTFSHAFTKLIFCLYTFYNSVSLHCFIIRFTFFGLFDGSKLTLENFI